MMKTYVQVCPNNVIWRDLLTVERKQELRRYIHQEGKNTGVILYMRDGSFQHASYCTLDLMLDNAFAWASCKEYEDAKSALDAWIKRINYLDILTKKANIYAIDLKENRDEVNDFYKKPVDLLFATNPKGYYLPLMRKPMKALEFNMLDFMDVGKIPANELYSVWVHFETGLVYCICGKDSQIDGEIRSLIPAAVNVNSTEELRKLYEESPEFRDMCARLVNKLENE